MKRIFLFEALEAELELMKAKLQLNEGNQETIKSEIERIAAEIQVARKPVAKDKSKKTNLYQVQTGCEIEIGDVIMMKNNWGTSFELIVRKTKTMAIGEKGIRFTKMFDFHFTTLPRNIWDSTNYKLLATYNPKCKQCGERFDVDETGSIFGKQFTENHPGFCSARC